MKEILIHGDIDPFWGINPRDVIAELQAAKGQEIALRIMSGGGDVFGGLSIYNYLRGIPKVTAYVDGLAASIASIVMLGAGRVVMPRNGFIMVHNPTGVVVGESEDMRDLADLLDRTGGQLADIYARETGKEKAATQAWMKDETWFDADQALAAGLIDEISEPVVLQAKFDLGRFSRTPTALKDLIAAASPQPKRKPMQKVIAALAELKILDISPGAAPPDEEKIAADIRASLGARATEFDEIRKRCTELEARAKAGLDARAKTAVENAVAEGRLDKAMAALMTNAYQADEEGTLKILAGLPKPTAGMATPPVRHGGGTDPGLSLKDRIAAEKDPQVRTRLRCQHWEEISRAN